MGKQLLSRATRPGRLALSKNNNSDLFTPLMEGFIEIMQLFVEKGATHLGNSFQKTATGDKSKHPLKVEFGMLFDQTQVTGPETLGHSINQDAPYKLSYLTPELHTFIIGASGWGKSNLLNILMEDNLKNGRPIIFIDPKGTKEAIKDFKSASSGQFQILWQRNYPERPCPHGPS